MDNINNDERNISNKIKNEWTDVIENQDRVEIVRMLEEGFPIDTALPSGNGLILAVHTGNLDFVKFMVGLGANVNAQCTEEDNSLLSPTIWAASTGSLEIIQYLIDCGAVIQKDLSHLKEHKEFFKTEIGQAIFFYRQSVISFLLDMGVRITLEQIDSIYGEFKNFKNEKLLETIDYVLSYQKALVEREELLSSQEIKSSNPAVLAGAIAIRKI